MNLDYTKWIGELSYLDIFIGFVSFLSFCLSVYEIRSRKRKEKTKLNLYVDFDAGFDLFHACEKSNKEFTCCIPCLFVNDAESDTAITKIELMLTDKTVIKCSQREESFFTYLNPEHYGPVAKSIRFPINLTRKQGTYGVLRFNLPLSTESPQVSKVIIHTNKKTVRDKHFVTELNASILKLFNEVDKQDYQKCNTKTNKCTHLDKK